MSQWPTFRAHASIGSVPSDGSSSQKTLDGFVYIEFMPPDPTSGAAQASASDLEAPESERGLENPRWTGWDVILIALFIGTMIIAFWALVTVAAQRLLFPQLRFADVSSMPLVSIVAQIAAYPVVLAFMYSVATRSGQSFRTAIRWNWPRQAVWFVVAGIVASLALEALAHVLPMPKQLPVERYFQTPLEAWVLSFFGMTLAPLVEELFFRGFLYPVLARRLGTFIAVVMTALGFSLIHMSQLARAWAPVLIVSLIGLVLTIVRAWTRSVAAGVLMHMAYNGAISALLFVASGGFRHLDKLAQ